MAAVVDLRSLFTIHSPPQCAYAAHLRLLLTPPNKKEAAQVAIYDYISFNKTGTASNIASSRPAIVTTRCIIIRADKYDLVLA
ncbi:hypothetical protein [Plesiomonas shigelloides]|uniref:hypothetical protein n=1 Tax=Plesiomonas shigelloides TaxID=703 RepID=UPI001C5A66D0|nr:hypothetical protein [Plesiomonas shigelloides]MBW3792580.1 hypothetical protein [Plesiomonas shigelloides]